MKEGNTNKKKRCVSTDEQETGEKNKIIMGKDYGGAAILGWFFLLMSLLGMCDVYVLWHGDKTYESFGNDRQRKREGGGGVDSNRCSVDVFSTERRQAKRKKQFLRFLLMCLSPVLLASLLCISFSSTAPVLLW